MKDKEKELLLARITKLKEHLEAFPHLKKEYPNLDAMLGDLHKAVAYQEVLEKDHALITFNKGELEDLAFFCEQIEQFVNNIAKISAASPNKYLTTNLLKNGEGGSMVDKLDKLRNAASAPFQGAFDKMIAFVNSIGAGITAGNLLNAFKEIVHEEFEMVDAKAIAKTTSLGAVKEMKLPIFENFFFADYDKSYKDKKAMSVPSASELKAAVDEVFSKAYVMSVGDFSTDLGKWIAQMKTDVGKLVTHQYAKCEVATDLIAADVTKQLGIRAKDHPVFGTLQAALRSAIMSQPYPVILSDFAQAMMTALDQINGLTVTLDLLQNVNTPDFFSSRLIGTVTLAEATLRAVNLNSPYYITGQPNFRPELRNKLNAWKENLMNALADGSQTVLELDGANFSAAAFKNVLMQNVSSLMPDVKNLFSGLVMQDLQLKGHTDLSSFNNQWDTPWRALIGGINPDALIQSNEQDVKLLAALYTNLYEILPSDKDVIYALMSSISNKANLALEKANKLEKDMKAGFSQVNKKMDHLQTQVTDIRNQVVEIRKDLNEVKQDVKEIKKDIKEIKEDVKYIKKKIDELEPSETNIEVNVEVNVDDLIDITTNVNIDVNFQETVKVIINKFLEQGDIEETFFEVDEQITLARWLVFSASARFGASIKGTLKNRLVDSGLGIESTGAITADAYAGLGFEAFSIGKFSLVEVIGTLHAELTAKAVARLTVNVETLIEGAVQASMELCGYAKLEFKALTFSVYEIESSRLEILVIKSPIYAIGFQVNTWKYQGAKRKSGEYVADLHPVLKEKLKAAYDYLSDPVGMAVDGAVWLVETGAELVYETGEAIYDGVSTLVDWVNPFN